MAEGKSNVGSETVSVTMSQCDQNFSVASLGSHVFLSSYKVDLPRGTFQRRPGGLGAAAVRTVPIKQLESRETIQLLPREVWMEHVVSSCLDVVVPGLQLTFLSPTCV